MKAKGRNPAIGWVVGFIFQFLGCLVLLMLDKKMTPEEKRLQAAREIMQGTYKPGRGKR